MYGNLKLKFRVRGGHLLALQNCEINHFREKWIFFLGMGSIRMIDKIVVEDYSELIVVLQLLLYNRGCYMKVVELIVLDGFLSVGANVKLT
ncbi:hypothetical protein PAECIP111893_01535 [Paenibacillus plantiphilus]|uniref:Uncharacterized protein n=1 Tax=Paenibacillus plantiphilus TaxID=2905650 RepID=A0ABN8GB30_9BACL|nr:hypothetical protein PAECIP111893_01535 [Paenibacillus plantiphilus]